MLSFCVHAPEQEEYEYGEEKSEGAAHDPSDGAEVLLQVNEYHRVLLRGTRGERPQRFASCNKTHFQGGVRNVVMLYL